MGGLYRFAARGYTYHVTVHTFSVEVDFDLLIIIYFSLVAKCVSRTVAW